MEGQRHEACVTNRGVVLNEEFEKSCCHSVESAGLAQQVCKLKARFVIKDAAEADD
jgi:hypothetical protein